jgi:ribokinase
MTVVVVGDVNVDLTAALTRFPHEGDDSSVTALGWGSGGSAANAAVALARIGAPARLLAQVGTDPAASIALQAAREAGVDLSLIQLNPQIATGLCYAAISPGGERTFFAFRGANMALQPDPQALHGATWLHLSGHALIEGRQRETTQSLVAEARGHELPISLDLCLPLLHARRDEILALLPDLTLLFANEAELRMLGTGTSIGASKLEVLRLLADQLYRQSNAPSLTIVAKCGAQGCLLADQTGVRHIPGFPVDTLDTNGCGDAFAAGFLAMRIGGAAHDASGYFGNACGALAATRPGAAESLPTCAEVEAFLKRHPYAFNL